MNSLKNVFAICGSTRKQSTNLQYLHAITSIFSDKINLTIYTNISDLPHFNPDNDNENVPAGVTDFRNQIRNSDGVLICTPEYAMGLPGSLKNALDWTVSSCEFSHKPVVAITASTSGQKAHESLIGTLKVIEAKINDDLQLLIPFAKTKINNNNQITHAETSIEIKKIIEAFLSVINENEKIKL